MGLKSNLSAILFSSYIAAAGLGCGPIEVLDPAGSGGNGNGGANVGAYGGSTENSSSGKNLSPLDIAECVVEFDKKWKQDDERAGIRWYSAWWCSPCRHQQQKFGEEAMDILKENKIFVDCYQPNATEMDPNSGCIEANLTYLPTTDFTKKDMALDVLVRIRREGFTAPEEFVLYMFGEECNSR